MKRILYWIPAIIWAIFLFYMSSKQGVSLPPFPFADKFAHIGAYTVFGFLIAMGLRRSCELDYVKLVILATLIAGFYGLSDEVHQIFVPMRSAEATDLLSDFVGGMFGGLIYGYRAFYTKKS